jgi:hypothetical protein
MTSPRAFGEQRCSKISKPITFLSGMVLSALVGDVKQARTADSRWRNGVISRRLRAPHEGARASTLRARANAY